MWILPKYLSSPVYTEKTTQKGREHFLCAGMNGTMVRNWFPETNWVSDPTSVLLKIPTIRGSLMTSTPIPTARPKEAEANPFARVARPLGLHRWLPIILLLQTYQRGWLLKDLIAGLALTAVLVPVGMGYAEASGLPAIYGLYSTIVPLVAYAIFGPSRILVLGPDSALAGIIAATIIPLAAGNPDRLVALAGLLALLTGALCILTGLARFGFLTDLLSKPIRYGYLNGIALTVLVGQLPKILGFASSGGNLIKEASNLVQGIMDNQTNETALVIGLASLIVIAGFKWWAPSVPGILIAVSGATLAVEWFDIRTQNGLMVVGPLPRGNGEFRLKPISKPRGWPDVITVFLRSMTEHWGGKVIAVIVSGYDGDGAAALCGIKEVGGITIVQKLDTAGQPDMPESAIESGCIDFVLSPARGYCQTNHSYC